MLDRALVFSGALNATGPASGQSIVGTGTIVSTDVADLVNLRGIGEGQRLQVAFRMVAALVGATACEFQVVVADSAALTTNVQVLGTSGPITAAALVAGAESFIAVNPDIATVARRFLGTRVVLTGTASAGSVFSGVIGSTRGGRRFYPSAPY